MMNEISDFKEFFTPLQNQLIQVLDENGAMTRRKLVRKLETPRTTVYDNLVKLQKKNLVKKFSRNNGKRGRPKVLWTLSKED